MVVWQKLRDSRESSEQEPQGSGSHEEAEIMRLSGEWEEVGQMMPEVGEWRKS